MFQKNYPCVSTWLACLSPRRTSLLLGCAAFTSTMRMARTTSNVCGGEDAVCDKQETSIYKITMRGQSTEVAWPCFLTGMRVFLTLLPVTSRCMYLQSLSIPEADASDGAAAALSLPRFRGRVEADDSGLVRIALMAAGNM